MFKIKVIGRYLGFAVGVALCIPAGVSAKITVAQKLYETSGIHEQVKGLPDLLFAQVQNEFQYADVNGELDRATYTEFKQLIDKSYASAQFKRSIVKQLDKNLKRQTAKQALSWFKSPLGQKIARLEAAASSPDGQAALEYYSQGLETHPPSTAYAKKILTLADSIGAIEASVNTILNIQLTMTTAMESASADFDNQDLETLNTQVENMRPQIAESVAESVVVAMLFTYKDLSLAELDEYIQFSRSAAGNEYQRASIQAMNTAFLNASKHFASELLRSKKQRQKDKAS